MICLNFVEREKIVQYFGEIEAGEYQRLVDKWSGVWSEAGVQVVMHVSRRGVQDEILECQPTALDWAADTEVDSDLD